MRRVDPNGRRKHCCAPARRSVLSVLTWGCQPAPPLSSVVTEAWPHKPYTFRALRKTFGAMSVRCDACWRYAPLSIGGLQEVDYRSKTFSCSQCGSEAYLAVIEPIKEAGMLDYRLAINDRDDIRRCNVHHDHAMTITPIGL